MTEKESDTKYAGQIKTQVLIAAGMSLAAAVVVFAVGAPLPRALAWLALLSTVLYSGYCPAFDRIAATSADEPG